MDQVVAPDYEGVATGGFYGGYGEAFGFGPGYEVAVRGDEAVGDAAGYPE